MKQNNLPIEDDLRPEYDLKKFASKTTRKRS